MPVGGAGGFAATRSTLEESLLNQERLVDLFNGTRVFPNSDRDGGKTHWTSVELLNDRLQYSCVHVIQPVLIHIEPCECFSGNLLGDTSVSADLCVVSHPAQQAVGHTWRAARAPCNFGCTLVVDAYIQEAGGTTNDVGQIFFRIVLEAFLSTQSVLAWAL